MKIGAVIPARYNSSRFPGKPLVKISGISMIERVYRQVLKCGKFPETIVATDSIEIAEEVKNFNGKFIMTSAECRSGTERVWEVFRETDLDAVVNIQGDEPLISAFLLSDVFDCLGTGEYPVVTAAFYNPSYSDFTSENVVKTVFNQNEKAVYFSRSPVPYSDKHSFKGFFQHIGIYGYTREALSAFIHFPLSELEKTEKLEQLRFIDNGIGIHVINTDYRSIGVDVPGDVKKIEKILKE